MTNLRPRLAGIVAGVTLAAVLLVYLSIWLLSVDGAGARALIAVWLWSLPVLGIGALLGWLAGTGLERAAHRGNQR